MNLIDLPIEAVIKDPTALRVLQGMRFSYTKYTSTASITIEAFDILAEFPRHQEFRWAVNPAILLHIYEFDATTDIMTDVSSSALTKNINLKQLTGLSNRYVLDNISITYSGPKNRVTVVDFSIGSLPMVEAPVPREP